VAAIARLDVRLLVVLSHAARWHHQRRTTATDRHLCITSHGYYWFISQKANSNQIRQRDSCTVASQLRPHLMGIAKRTSNGMAASLLLLFLLLLLLLLVASENVGGGISGYKEMLTCFNLRDWSLFYVECTDKVTKLRSNMQFQENIWCTYYRRIAVECMTTFDCREMSDVIARRKLRFFRDMLILTV